MSSLWGVAVMPAPKGNKNNPNIGKMGVDTRFGGKRANPHSSETDAPAATSVRKALKDLCNQKFEKDANGELTGMTLGRLTKVLGGKNHLDGAQMLACMKFARAMSGDLKAINEITNLLEGPEDSGTQEISLADLIVRSRIEHDSGEDD